MNPTLPVYFGPVRHPDVEARLVAAGAELVDAPADARALIWTDPFKARDLIGALHPVVEWVSLPMAGVDRLIAAGFIDNTRVWTATKGVYADAVAEHAIALLLACSRRIAAAVRRGSWSSDPGWRLRGERIAILGAGGIGRAVADRLVAFGAIPIGFNSDGRPAPGFAETARSSALAETLAGCRGLIIAVPFTAETNGLVGERELEALGPDGVVVNVARGEIIDQQALVTALADGRLGGAGLDVTDPEPLPDGHPLWSLANAVVTSHNANPYRQLPWDACVAEYAEHLAGNVAALASGQPLDGVVDVSKGY
jgi:phosphoglycerate dehydrogenase-like enzyme